MISRDTGFWVWADAAEFLQGSERIRRRPFSLSSGQAVPCWEPQVDLYEQEGKLHLLMALPGVASRDIVVILEEAAILVRGERLKPDIQSVSCIHRLELPYGRFERRVPLPAGDFMLEKHTLESGCLAVELRRLP